VFDVPEIETGHRLVESVGSREQCSPLGEAIEARIVNSALNKSEKGTLVMTPRTTPQGRSGFFFFEGKGR
jgi:hypothetical protein